MLHQALSASCFGGVLLVGSLAVLDCGNSAGEVGIIPGFSTTGTSAAGGNNGNGAAGSSNAAGNVPTGTGTGGIDSSGSAGSVQAGSGGVLVAAEGGAPAEAGASVGNPCDGRKVCDDFEKWTTGMQPGMPWKMRLGKGTVTVDETRAVSGTHSLRVHIDATTTTDTSRDAMISITGAPLLPVTNNTVYGRFMIWTDRIPDKTVHWTTAHGDGPQGAANSGLSATYNYGGMGDLMANYYRNTSPNPNDCWQTKSVNFPTNKWTCVAFVFNGPNNEMDYWQDGVEIPELHVLGNSKTDQTCTVKGVEGKWLAPSAWKNVSIGWESYQHDAAGAHDAWIDDVILDDKPVACPPTL